MCWGHKDRDVMIMNLSGAAEQLVQEQDLTIDLATEGQVSMKNICANNSSSALHRV